MAQGPINRSLFGLKVARGTPNRFLHFFFLVSFFFSFFVLVILPFVTYSIRIGGEWCRIIHDKQQPVCSECNEVGPTRKHCPKIECRICKQKGHLSYVCDRNNKQENNKQESNEVPAEDVSTSLK